MCEQVVCVSKLCVSKLCVDKLCVSKLCVSKLCVSKRRRREEADGGIQNQKQEPHTKMWGTNTARECANTLMFDGYMAKCVSMDP